MALVEDKTVDIIKGLNKIHKIYVILSNQAREITNAK